MQVASADVAARGAGEFPVSLEGAADGPLENLFEALCVDDNDSEKDLRDTEEKLKTCFTLLKERGEMGLARKVSSALSAEDLNAIRRDLSMTIDHQGSVVTLSASLRDIPYDNAPALFAKINASLQSGETITLEVDGQFLHFVPAEVIDKLGVHLGSKITLVKFNPAKGNTAIAKASLAALKRHCHRAQEEIKSKECVPPVERESLDCGTLEAIEADLSCKMIWNGSTRCIEFLKRDPDTPYVLPIERLRLLAQSLSATDKLQIELSAEFLHHAPVEFIQAITAQLGSQIHALHYSIDYATGVPHTMTSQRALRQIVKACAPVVKELGFSGCLTLPGSNVIELVASTPGLLRLDLSFCQMFQLEHLSTLVRYCPELTVLKLEGCKHITKAELLALNELKQLVQLQLAHTNVTVFDLEALLESRSFFNLLDLSSCQQVTDSQIIERLMQKQIVAFFDLRGCASLDTSKLMSVKSHGEIIPYLNGKGERTPFKGPGDTEFTMSYIGLYLTFAFRSAVSVQMKGSELYIDFPSNLRQAAFDPARSDIIFRELVALFERQCIHLKIPLDALTSPQGSLMDRFLMAVSGSLTQLFVYPNQIARPVVARRFDRLKRLGLSNTGLTEQDLEKLVCPQLVKLDVAKCPHLDATGVPRILMRYPRLRELDLPIDSKVVSLESFARFFDLATTQSNEKLQADLHFWIEDEFDSKVRLQAEKQCFIVHIEATSEVVASDKLQTLLNSLSKIKPLDMRFAFNVAVEEPVQRLLLPFHTKIIGLTWAYVGQRPESLSLQKLINLVALCTELERLHIENYKLPPSALKELPGASPKLRVLALHRCTGVTGEQIASTVKIWRLLGLSLSGMENISDGDVRAIAEAHLLSELQVVGSPRVTGSCIADLSTLLPCLESLDLSRCSVVDESLRREAFILPELHTLRLSYNKGLTEKALGQICEVPRLLKALGLAGTQVIFEPTPNFQKNLPLVRELCLNDCPNIPPANFIYLTSIWTNMQRLELRGSHLLTEENLEAIVRENPLIPVIDVQSCPNISDRVAIDLVRYNPEGKLKVDSAMNVSESGLRILLMRHPRVQRLKITQSCPLPYRILRVVAEALPKNNHLRSFTLVGYKYNERDIDHFRYLAARSAQLVKFFWKGPLTETSLIGLVSLHTLKKLKLQMDDSADNKLPLKYLGFRILANGQLHLDEIVLINTKMVSAKQGLWELLSDTLQVRKLTLVGYNPALINRESIRGLIEELGKRKIAAPEIVLGAPSSLK